MFYEQLQKAFLDLIRTHDLAGQEVKIEARILTSEEALGNPSRRDYPLLKGREFLMEAQCLGERGQAFTDAPTCVTSTLEKIAAGDLNSTPERALFIATLNAVVRHLEPDLKTIHCRNDEPEECAKEIVAAIAPLQVREVGLVGLQPAILEALVNRFGAGHVHCLDRDEARRGAVKFGVPIGWGDEAGTGELFGRSDLVLATGSTVVNGTLPGLLRLVEEKNVPLFFYGTTIAGTARLMNLNRFCFKAA
jgi:uncharacterized protein (DUF4213/DUF364 family)